MASAERIKEIVSGVFGEKGRPSVGAGALILGGWEYLRREGVVSREPVGELVASASMGRPLLEVMKDMLPSVMIARWGCLGFRGMLDSLMEEGPAATMLGAVTSAKKMSVITSGITVAMLLMCARSEGEMRAVTGLMWDMVEKADGAVAELLDEEGEDDDDEEEVDDED